MPHLTARLINEHFEAWFAMFRRASARQAEHFAAEDWQAASRESRSRLATYERTVRDSLGKVRQHLGKEIYDRDTWAQIRGEFSGLRDQLPNTELAETYFNSHTRRVFQTVGVDPYIEFVAEALTVPQSMEADDAFTSYEPTEGTTDLVARVLSDIDLGTSWRDLQEDARLVAEQLDRAVTVRGARVGAVDILEPVFFRNKGAYVIGRVRAGDSVMPLILPILHHPEGGLRVDAALLSSNEASQVFSFTRSYFNVDHPQPWALVRFLKSLMPLKRIAELYISLGFVKHGKTELYRDLVDFLEHTTEKFERARGTRGMVMTVFTLPDYDIVFKIIKDNFDPVKQSTRQEVRQKYRFVMLHDRVGRLADVQEYEHLTFPVNRFDPVLLEELLEECPSTIHIEDDDVVIEHLYMERRVTPLNLYLLEEGEADAREAVLDTGYAIKDLAAANIFPGDMLLKNFGVTRHGRVIFYDYDELDHLDAFNFRDKPKPRDEFEMMSSDAWYYVAPNDIFPEEIGRFMGFPSAYAGLFHEAHGDLMTREFWNQMQARHDETEPVDLFPYSPDKRFPV